MLFLEDDEVRVVGSGTEERWLRYDVRLGFRLKPLSWGVFETPWMIEMQLGSVQPCGIILPQFLIRTSQFRIGSVPNARSVYDRWLRLVEQERQWMSDDVRLYQMKSCGDSLLRVCQRLQRVGAEFNVATGESTKVWLQLDQLELPVVLPRRFNFNHYFYHRVTADD
ncbi:MAG: hypothetical protein E6P95_00930 [Candidatus Moraniibacteriota bacterium]|nr:MAG: hypothetical protein E6P95_00930 [Candidatus Moranbacteria bacterium]